jgi:hypothetical protein
MTADLDAIEARYEAATPGPWRVEKSWVVGGKGRGEWNVACVAGEPPRDADFIAHARTDIPALLAAIDDYEARIAAQKSEMEAAVEREAQHLAAIDELEARNAKLEAVAEAAKEATLYLGVAGNRLRAALDALDD